MTDRSHCTPHGCLHKVLCNQLIADAVSAAAAGQRVPVTPKGQSMSPGLHGMALSPGTLLPQLPLHGLHQPQASLINPAHVRSSATNPYCMP